MSDVLFRHRPLKPGETKEIPERYMNMITDFRIARLLDNKAGLISRENLPKQHSAVLEYNHPDQLFDSIMFGVTDLKVIDEELRCVRVLMRVHGLRAFYCEEYFFPLKDYNRTWRCWYSSPSRETRQEAKWDVCDDAG